MYSLFTSTCDMFTVRILCLISILCCSEKPKESKKTVKGLPVVPESVLKHRKRRDAGRTTKLQSAFKKRAEKVKKRKLIFKRAEQYVKEYRLKERDEIRLIRQAKNRGNYYIPGEAKLAFVIRIRG